LRVPSPKRLSALGSGWQVPAALRRFYADVVWLEQLAIDELRPGPGRIRTSVRMAFISAVGIALMAALHVDGALGPVTLWVALYASSARLTASEGLIMIVVYAVTLSASVFLAGVLIDVPWMLVPFFGVATALMLYALNKLQLGGAWFNVVVAFLDTFYLCAFDPKNFGWSVAYTFSGIAVAIGVLVAFDMVLWPDPAERRLLRSLADTLDSQGQRLAAIGRAYLDPLAVAVLPQPAGVSVLSSQLPLLERARRELGDPQREAILLAAVTTTERVHIEIERLLAVARDDVPRDIRLRLQPEMKGVLQTLAAALQHQAHQAATGLGPSDDSTEEELNTAIRSSLDTLQEREKLALSQRPPAGGPAIANIAAFNLGLRRIGLRLLNKPLGDVHGLAFPQDTRSGATQSGGADRALMRHCAKLGLAATLAYVVGVASHRSELAVIVWTAVIAGLPTYGATLRKMILRIVGAVIGGLLGLLMIFVVSPNFESLGSYLLAFFIALFVAAYVGLSSGRLAYAGQQGGVSFVLAYASLSPNANVYEPLWRVWGIFLGLVIVTLVFLLITPEYAGKAIVPRLTGILHAALELLRPAAGMTEQRVQEINTDVTLDLTQVLGIAEDARLEGRHSGIVPDSVVDAAGTLRRIVHHLTGIATGRLAIPQTALPAEIQTARAGCDTAVRHHLQSWLEVLEDEHGPDRRRILEVAAHFTPDDLAVPLAELNEYLSGSGLGELESYSRLMVLVTELDHQFVEIPAAGAR